MKYAVLFTGIAGETQGVFSGDLDQLLVTALPPDPTRQLTGVLITCEDFNVRFTLGNTIPTAVFGHLLYNGQSIKLINSQQVGTFRFTNAVPGSGATLHITYEYEI